LFALSPVFANRVFNAPELINPFRIASVLILFNTLDVVQNGALMGFEAFKSSALVSIARGILNILVVVVAAKLFGLLGAITASVLVVLLGYFINRIALSYECRSRGIRATYRDAASERCVLWEFSVPAFLAGAITAPTTWLGNAMLVNQPHGYIEMGVLNAANRWRTGILFLPSTVSKVSLAMLCSLHGQRDTRTRALLKSSLVQTLGLTFLVAAPVAICARWIMLSYGNEFSNAALVLVLSAVTCILMAPNTIIGNVLVSLGAMWMAFLLNLLWAVAFLIFARTFLTHGALGLAIAYTLSYMVHTISQGSFMASAFRARKTES